MVSTGFQLIKLLKCLRLRTETLAAHNAVSSFRDWFSSSASLQWLIAQKGCLLWISSRAMEIIIIQQSVVTQSCVLLSRVYKFSHYMLYYNGFILCKWNKYIQKRMFDRRHQPLVVMVETGLNQISELVAICLKGNVKIWGLGGKNVFISCLCSEWVGCLYNISDFSCDRNSLVVWSLVPLAMFFCCWLTRSFLFQRSCVCMYTCSSLLHLHFKQLRCHREICWLLWQLKAI